MNPGKTQWHRSVTICSALKELNLPSGTYKWDYHITKSLASYRCSSQNFSLIIFLNDMETKSFKSRFISQTCISMDPSTLIELSLVPRAGLPIHNLKVLQSPPLTWHLAYFWFLTTWLLFPSVKAAAPLASHMLGFNGKQIDASNLMNRRPPDLPAEHSLRWGVSRLSLPYVIISAVYTLLGNFTGKTLLEMFILGFCNLFFILI